MTEKENLKVDRSYFEKTSGQAQPDRKLDSTTYGKLTASQNYCRKK